MSTKKASRKTAEKKPKIQAKLSRDQSDSDSETETKTESKIKSEAKPETKIEPISAVKYPPIIVEISNEKTGILSSNLDMEYSSTIDYPREEYGFHHFIHSNKNKMEILGQFEGKKKVYLVMNKFERYVDGYDKSIGLVSKDYFTIGKNGRPDILSRGFYKLWEILMLFDLIDVKSSNFVSAHLAEGPGSFIQAVMFYRDMFCANVSKNDKYHAITLHPEDTGGPEHIPELEEKFVEFYKKEKPQRFILHKTSTKAQSGGNPKKDNGDITNPKTIKLFGGDFTEKADLVTGDGGFDWINENVQEQEAFKLIIAQIATAFKVQKKGGSFVLKMFETFAKTSVKFVAILCDLYEHVYFVKPLTSRPSNSEKYAVCKGFKFDDKQKEYKDIEKKFDELVKSLHKNAEIKNPLKLVDIFPDFIVPKKILHKIIHANRLISNQQLKSINEIVAFIKREIYSGDEYHTKKEEQIEGAKYWNDLFFPASQTNKQLYENIVSGEITRRNIQTDKLSQDLVDVVAQ